MRADWRFKLRGTGPDDASDIAAIHEAGAVRSVYVRPGHWRRGLGRRLAAAMFGAARDAGMPRLELDASLNSVSFYEALGFRRLGDAEHRFARGASLLCVHMVRDAADGPGDCRR